MFASGISALIFLVTSLFTLLNIRKSFDPPQECKYCTFFMGTYTHDDTTVSWLPGIFLNSLLTHFERGYSISFFLFSSLISHFIGPGWWLNLGAIVFIVASLDFTRKAWVICFIKRNPPLLSISN